MADNLLQELDLVRRARAGDNDAFSRLVLLFTPALYRVVRRLASDDAEAEALVQEAFLRVWRCLSRLQPGKDFFPYLVTIALNLGRDQWRRAQPLDFGGLEPVEETLVDAAPGPEEALEEAELMQALEQAVTALPPAYRLAISLRYEAGLDYRQMAEVLELPVNTVRTHLRRAKAHLRASLREAAWQAVEEDTLGKPVERPAA